MAWVMVDASWSDTNVDWLTIAINISAPVVEGLTLRSKKGHRYRPPRSGKLPEYSGTDCLPDSRDVRLLGQWAHHFSTGFMSPTTPTAQQLVHEIIRFTRSSRCGSPQLDDVRRGRRRGPSCA